MKIADLKVGMKGITINAKVVKKLEERNVRNKRGRLVRLAKYIISDDSGTITLILWGRDIDKVNVGDAVKIENGYVNEFRGEIQVTLGRFGKIEKL